MEVEELKDDGHWETGILKELSYPFREQPPCELIAEGFIEIKEDDIYTFFAHVSQLYIGGELIIDSQGKSKRAYLPGMKALKAGKHKIKIVFLNNIEKGVDSAWYNLGIEIQSSKSNERAKITKEQLSHVPEQL
jgi:hexosaminidase